MELVFLDEGYTREAIGEIWKRLKDGDPLEDEEEIVASVLGEHGEYREYWENLEQYIDYEFSPEKNEVNPFLHLAVHIIIENQLSQNDPPETSETVQAMMKNGFSRHDAFHRIGVVLIEEVFDCLKNFKPFDREKYIEKLREFGKIQKLSAEIDR